MWNFLKSLIDYKKDKISYTDTKEKEITTRQKDALKEMNANCEEMLVIADKLPDGLDKDKFIAAINKYKSEINRFQKSLA